MYMTLKVFSTSEVLENRNRFNDSFLINIKFVFYFMRQKTLG